MALGLEQRVLKRHKAVGLCSTLSSVTFLCTKCGRRHSADEFEESRFCRTCGTYLTILGRRELVRRKASNEPKREAQEKSIFPYQPYPQQLEFMKDIVDAVDSHQVLIAEACSGFGKTVCALSSILSLGRNIIYATRTHEQARQVLHEVEVINSRSSRFFSAVSLASRRHLCIDDRCRGLPPIESAEACRIMRETHKCQFRSEILSIPQSLPKVLTIQTLQSKGRALMMCPYFLARKAAETSTVVVTPYQYVFNQVIRERTKLELTDKVLVFDEAHNADKISLDAMSDTASERTLTNAKKELDLVNIQSDFIDRLTEYVNQNASNDVISKPGTVLREELAQVLEVEDLATFVESINEVPDEIRRRKVENGEAPSSYMGGLSTFLSLVASSIADRYVAIFRTSVLGFSMLEYRCLDPSLAIGPVIKESSGTVLMSGTLSPLELFAEVIGLPDAKTRAYSAIARRENVRLLIDNQVTSRFSERSEEMIRLYGQRISEVAREIPSGILIFFPQRAFMLKAVEFWRDAGILSESSGRLHLERRPVFIEGETAAQNRMVVEEYKRAAHDANGAALLAIFRGRNAEGSNFPDQEARGVFLVGVPYAAYNDPVVKAQIAFFDSRRASLGRRWYTMDAFRSANQAMGRGIRHREHWCTFVLMDERYQSHINMIAGWARANGVDLVQ